MCCLPPLSPGAGGHLGPELWLWGGVGAPGGCKRGLVGAPTACGAVRPERARRGYKPGVSGLHPLGGQHPQLSCGSESTVVSGEGCRTGVSGDSSGAGGGGGCPSNPPGLRSHQGNGTSPVSLPRKQREGTEKQRRGRWEGGPQVRGARVGVDSGLAVREFASWPPTWGACVAQGSPRPPSVALHSGLRNRAGGSPPLPRVAVRVGGCGHAWPFAGPAGGRACWPWSLGALCAPPPALRAGGLFPGSAGGRPGVTGGACAQERGPPGLLGSERVRPTCAPGEAREGRVENGQVTRGARGHGF